MEILHRHNAIDSAAGGDGRYVGDPRHERNSRRLTASGSERPRRRVFRRLFASGYCVSMPPNPQSLFLSSLAPRPSSLRVHAAGNDGRRGDHDDPGRGGRNADADVKRFAAGARGGSNDQRVFEFRPESRDGNRPALRRHLPRACEQRRHRALRPQCRSVRSAAVLLRRVGNVDGHNYSHISDFDHRERDLPFFEYEQYA